MTDLESLWLELPSPEPTLRRNNGITWAAAHRVGGLRWAGVRYERTGRFELNTEDAPALLIGCWQDPPSTWRSVPDPLLIDIVAVDPAQPRRYATYCGAAALLGEVCLHEARFFRRPLPVFRDPIGWLQAEGRGVVPLSATRFALAVTTIPEITLVGADLAHGRELKRMIDGIRYLGQPRIGVRSAP